MFGTLVSSVVQGHLAAIVMMGLTVESSPFPGSQKVDICITGRKIISVCWGTCSDKTAKANAAFQRLPLGQAGIKFEDRIQVKKAMVLTTLKCGFYLVGVKRFTI